MTQIDPYYRAVILDALKTAGRLTVPQLLERVRSQAHNEDSLRRELRHLLREGIVTREVRRRFHGIQNSAFRSGASVLRREAVFALAQKGA